MFTNREPHARKPLESRLSTLTPSLNFSCVLTMASTTPTAHVLCVGPLLLDRLTFLSDALERIHPAGNALIFSAVAARMGLKVAVAGQTGADDNGDIIARFLEIHGVGSSHVRRLAGRVTKVTKVIIDLDGEWRRESANIDVFPYIDAEYVQTIC